MINKSKACRNGLNFGQRDRDRFSQQRSRRGALYLIVVVMTMMIGMMGMAAIHVAGLTLKESSGNSNRYMAKLLATSAIENGLTAIQSNPDWRTTLSSGFEYPDPRVSFNGGSFVWKVIDDDGILSDDLADTVLVQGIGSYEGVVHVEEVRLQPIEAGLTCLESSLTCNGDITPTFLIDINTNQMISSNGNINASAFGADVNGDAWAVGSVSGNVSGDQLLNQSPPREMPGPDVFDYYVHMGTHIDIDSLPLDSDTYILEKVVLSPANNPYGSANGEGIYVINCFGNKINARKLRVDGTLVLLNPHEESRLENQVCIRPAVSNFPSLLVDGTIQIRTVAQNLKEADEGVNYNPPGSPFEGDEDTDQSDEYSSRIQGLVYVSGRMDLMSYFNISQFKGVVVCGSMTATTATSLEYDGTYLLNPPPGFAAGSVMQVIPGSWARVASP